MATIRITAEAIERHERISQDPFTSDVHHVVYPTPVTKDDCVFKHADDYLRCVGCEPNPWGGEPWPHVHLVTVGSNGGARCDAYGSLEDLLNDLRYPRVRLETVRDEGGSVIGVALMGRNQYAAGLIPVSREVGTYLTALPDERDVLIEQGILFEEDTEDESGD